MNRSLIKKLSFIYYRLLSFFKACASKVKALSKEPLFKARVGTIFAAFVLTASILAWGTIDTGLAWFASNKNVNAVGMQTRLENVPSVTANLKSYGITKIDGNKYTVLTDEQVYSLPQHDPNEISYSQYKLALLIEIEMWSDEDISIDLVASTNNTDYSLEAVNYVSNCIKLTSATFDSSTNVAAKGNESFAFTSTTILDENVVCNKVGEINIHSCTLTSEKQTVYFLMEYNVDFLNFINEYILFNRVDNPIVNYSNDLVFIIREQE